MKKLTLIAGLLLLGGLLGLQINISQNFDVYDKQIQALWEQLDVQAEQTFGAVNPVAGKRYFISGGGITSSATSLILTEFTTPVSDYPMAMSDFGTIGYLTLEPSSDTRQEIVSFTGITQNADGTATLTGLTRGLSPISPYTASTTLQKAHSGGSIVVLSNPPQLYNLFANKNNTEYITGAWGFQGTAPTSTACASANELCNKNYVDNVTNAGAATSTETNGGIVELATQIEMASSTDGGANKPLVLQAKYATSTPGTAGLWAVVTNNAGKIAQGFLDWTQNIAFSGINTHSGLETFSGGHLTTASSTLTATTTFAGDVVGIFPNATSTVFTSSGTWIRPAGVNKVKVTVVGGGGGAGSGVVSGGTASAGGGAGGYCEAIVSVTGNVTVTVGAAGAGGTNGAAAGSAGGNSSFAGATTPTANGGSGGAAGSSGSIVAGGAGGATSNCNLGITGRNGEDGDDLNTSNDAGDGGSNPLGMGGEGANRKSATGEDGKVGSGYGAGGGGATAENAGSEKDGAAGTAGVVIVEWYQTTPYTP